MYQFPKGFYSDVRIEDRASTLIVLETGELKTNKISREQGAFIRLFDGKMWYYSALTQLDRIQEELDRLATLGDPQGDLKDHPILRRMEIHRGEFYAFADNAVEECPHERKEALLRTYLPIFEEFSEVKSHKANYIDRHTKIHFLSSLGADIRFDSQYATIAIRWTIMNSKAPFQSGFDIFASSFDGLTPSYERMRETLRKDVVFSAEAVPVVPGQYTCVLAPVVAGVFAHESFGHKSEADFMLGDESMMQEWEIGKTVGSEILSIVDMGEEQEICYVPFDDEGNRARKNYLIKNGKLTGRLHSAMTAAALDEGITANARAISFEYEPIVRMTNTYIEGGKYTFDELIAEVPEGIYIEDLKHGSGMSTFTIAPSKAWMIRDGKLAEPVQVSVISGNVMRTLSEIDGLSKEVELFSFATGGCGKMEQYPLKVGFGGPYVRVHNIDVK